MLFSEIIHLISAWAGFVIAVILGSNLYLFPYWIGVDWYEISRKKRLDERHFLDTITRMVYGPRWYSVIPRTYRLTSHYRHNPFLFSVKPKKQVQQF